MALKEKDFIEIEFTGRIKNTGEIFDTNIQEDLHSIGGDKSGIKTKSFIFSLGQGMFLKGIDDFLIGKSDPEKPVNYNIELSPENAFGQRNPKLIQLVPIKVFYEHKIQPVQGKVFNFDGRVAKVLSVSGGRVIVDFNNLIAGKTVVYDIRILKKIEDLNEKIKSFINFLLGQEFKFEVKDKDVIIEVPKEMKNFVEVFEGKFKEIFNLSLKVKEIEPKKIIDEPNKAVEKGIIKKDKKDHNNTYK
ncbi:MAG TPA: FKBP-type peptidyl-prolyl cis-trans isomerase [Candidatus Nanoarchaeia archaeon]|nr:FKBP-type peptidyl-prolyl cis-trans isomerase [Candidatus Nanoarchaeia archaeon]